MKPTPDEQFREILRRSDALRRKKDQRTNWMLACSSAALAAMLILSIHLMVRDHIPEGTKSVSGASLLPAEAEGYMLAAVIAFTLSVTVTVLILRKRTGNHNPTGDFRDEEIEETKTLTKARNPQ